MRIRLASEEVNVLVLRYLMENGFEHSFYTFFNEAKMAKNQIYQKHAAKIPSNMLISFLQKALMYIYVEYHTDEETGKQSQCEQIFSIFRVHDCDNDSSTVDGQEKSREIKRNETQESEYCNSNTVNNKSNNSIDNNNNNINIDNNNNINNNNINNKRMNGCGDEETVHMVNENVYSDKEKRQRDNGKNDTGDGGSIISNDDSIKENDKTLKKKRTKTTKGKIQILSYGSEKLTFDMYRNNYSQIFLRQKTENRGGRNRASVEYENLNEQLDSVRTRKRRRTNRNNSTLGHAGERHEGQRYEGQHYEEREHEQPAEKETGQETGRKRNAVTHSTEWKNLLEEENRMKVDAERIDGTKEEQPYHKKRDLQQGVIKKRMTTSNKQKKGRTKKDDDGQIVQNVENVQNRRNTENDLKFYKKNKEREYMNEKGKNQNEINLNSNTERPVEYQKEFSLNLLRKKIKDTTETDPVTDIMREMNLPSSRREENQSSNQNDKDNWSNPEYSTSLFVMNKNNAHIDINELTTLFYSEHFINDEMKTMMKETNDRKKEKEFEKNTSSFFGVGGPSLEMCVPFNEPLLTNESTSGIERNIQKGENDNQINDKERTKQEEDDRITLVGYECIDLEKHTESGRSIVEEMESNIIREKEMKENQFNVSNKNGYVEYDEEMVTEKKLNTSNTSRPPKEKNTEHCFKDILLQTFMNINKNGIKRDKKKDQEN